jgi:tetratricopeptide (TPR) repeat protein
MLPAEAIAAEIETSVDFLATTMRDVPARHRSVRAVFDHSWNLLTEEERAAFRRLSVFRGGFTRQAAEQVAGAGLGALARLLDKSLLQADASGRYSVHELLRQFAEEQLSADTETERRTYERHSDFFLEFLQRKDPELRSRQQLAAMTEIDREFENVRGAWNWALQRGRWERLRQAITALNYFMEVRSRHQEAIGLFQRVVDTVERAEHGLEQAESNPEEIAQRQGLAAVALTVQSWFFFRLLQFEKQRSCLERSHAAIRQFGKPTEIAFHNYCYALCCPDPEEAQALFEESLATFRAIGSKWGESFVINGMGYFAFGRGRPLEARQLCQEALAYRREIGDAAGMSMALLILCRVAYMLGDYEEGRGLLQESLALQQTVNSKIVVVDCFNLLGQIAYAQGQLEEAEAHFRQELAIVRDLGHREFQSWCLSRLGAAVLAQGRQADAAGLLAEGLALAESSGDPQGMAYTHNQLGELAFKQGARDTARQHWRAALEMARRMQGREQLLVILNALMGLATLLTAEGAAERAIELLTLVRRAATIDRRTETKVEQQLAGLEASLPAGQFTAAQARGRARELEATLAEILAESRS